MNNKNVFFFIGIASITLFVFPQFLVQDSDNLRLFVDRKEISERCMRGYLLTQLNTEANPKVACYILEQPPRDNAPYVSSIPAGTYSVKIRTDGARGWRLELKNVPGRDNVQIHIGNYPAETVGCLLPGKNASTNQCSVLQSKEAMDELKTLFALFGSNGNTELTIRDVN